MLVTHTTSTAWLSGVTSITMLLASQPFLASLIFRRENWHQEHNLCAPMFGTTQRSQQSPLLPNFPLKTSALLAGQRMLQIPRALAPREPSTSVTIACPLDTQIVGHGCISWL